MSVTDSSTTSSPARTLNPAGLAWLILLLLGSIPIFWIGFVIAFWPDGGIVTTASFVVFSLLGHWLYGFTLGLTLDRTTGIPEHEV